jgi:hypothetical protein
MKGESHLVLLKIILAPAIPATNLKKVAIPKKLKSNIDDMDTSSIPDSKRIIFLCPLMGF